jgi:hypothetical protein
MALSPSFFYYSILTFIGIDVIKKKKVNKPYFSIELPWVSNLCKRQGAIEI